MTKIFMLLCMAGCLLPMCSPSKTAQSDSVMIVNGTAISSTQMEQAAQYLRQGVIQMYPEKALEGMSPEIRKGAAKQLVANIVMIEEALKKGFVADTNSVNQTFTKLSSQFETPEQMDTELARMGETRASLKKQIQEGIVLDLLMKEVIAKADTVTEEECKSFYSKNSDKYITAPRVKASQILFVKSEKNAQGDAIKTKAQTVLAEIRAGALFSSMAKRHSSGPGVENGGDIGWYTKGELRPELDKALFGMKVNETSDVIESEVGFHILKKTGEEPGKPMSYEEAREHAKNALDLKKKNNALTRFADSLINVANVQYLDTSLTPGPMLPLLPDSTTPSPGPN